MAPDESVPPVLETSTFSAPTAAPEAPPAPDGERVEVVDVPAPDMTAPAARPEPAPFDALAHNAIEVLAASRLAQQVVNVAWLTAARADGSLPRECIQEFEQAINNLNIYVEDR